MANIRVYHGSDHIIEKPILTLGRIKNDYGMGFYTTEDVELAKEWAAKNNKNGILNEYILDDTNLKVLNLMDGNYTVLNWIALLLDNRVFNIVEQVAKEARDYILDNFLIDVSNYDVIIGYRADDSYFAYAQSFINNGLSVELLSKALMLGNLGIQIALVSEKAFNSLKFVSASKVDLNTYFKKYSERDTSARNEYNETIKNKSNLKTDLFVLDIMRMEMKNDDKRLQKFIFR